MYCDADARSHFPLSHHRFICENQFTYKGDQNPKQMCPMRQFCLIVFVQQCSKLRLKNQMKNQTEFHHDMQKNLADIFKVDNHHVLLSTY